MRMEILISSDVMTDEEQNFNDSNPIEIIWEACHLPTIGEWFHLNKFTDKFPYSNLVSAIGCWKISSISWNKNERGVFVEMTLTSNH